VAGPPEEDELPPRWGTFTAEDLVAAATPQAEPGTSRGRGNPFVNLDMPPPQVKAAQGASVSGSRTIGFATGGAQVTAPALPRPSACASAAAALAMVGWPPSLALMPACR
jgi:hypothetical protein